MSATQTVQDLREWLRSVHPAPHPCLPYITLDEAWEKLQFEQGRLAYIDWVNKHRARLAAAEADPLGHGFEPPCWADADRLLESDQVDLQANFGANRSGKSWRAGRRLCEAAWAYKHGQYLVLGETDASSKRTQQMIVWYFLKGRIEHLNGRRHPVYKVNYSEANGFTDKTLVLPNHSFIQFDTYASEAGKYEGWEFGAKIRGLNDWLEDHTLNSLQYRPDGSPILNIGVWADESLSLAWLLMIARRARFRRSKILWTITPVSGITPAMKECRGTPKVLQTRPADLLPQSQIPGCPPGHMPYIEEPAFPRSIIIYTHVDQIVFGGYETIIRENCQGKTTEYIERIAYGYARDTIGRALPNFGTWNVVEPEAVPEQGTVYMFCDPHGDRNYAIMWVLASADNPTHYYIIRDWPDEPTYGEWAVTTEREINEDSRKGWDGDRGPAQDGLGWGVYRYKQLFREKESILLPEPLRRQLQGWRHDAMSEQSLNAALQSLPCPWHRWVLRRALYEGKELSDLTEHVGDRYIDIRYAQSKKSEAGGTTTLHAQFGEFQTDPQTGERVPPVDFLLSSGQNISHGLTLVNDLLDWNRAQPMVPYINAPRLYVTTQCKQVIWAFSNYTGRAGESGACKEWVDLARHLAEAAPIHRVPGKSETRGGGSY